MVIETDEGKTVICQDDNIIDMGISLEKGDSFVFRIISAFDQKVWFLRVCGEDAYETGTLITDAGVRVGRSRCHLVLAIV